MNFYEDYPYGSARFATAKEVRRAFRKMGGIPVGFFAGRLLFHSRQAGALLIGGAGSGKFVSVLAHIMADQGRGKGQPPRYAILDPKGELAAVIGRGLVHARHTSIASTLTDCMACPIIAWRCWRICCRTHPCWSPIAAAWR